MRFLIGIIIGATATLFIATAVDAPTHSTLARVLYHGERIWDGLIDGTTDTLFKVQPARPPEDSGAATQVADPVRVLSTPAEVPASPGPSMPEPSMPGSSVPGPSVPGPSGSGLSDAAPDRARGIELPTAGPQPGLARRPYSELTDLPASETWEDEPLLTDSADLADFTEPLVAASDGADPLPRLPLPGSLAHPAASQSGSNSTEATVWAPFHSQMSAQGFAARLGRELDHPFRVQRLGAGAYQVVFDAPSELEQDLLLARIAEITGR